MSRRSALRKAFSLAAIVASAAFLMPAAQNASAQSNNGSAAGPSSRVLVVPRGQPVIGGYSLRLSDVWGPAKMPPAPKDFGPHFDFPPAPLNSVPLPDPYPH
jgi:hypothetical protein